MKKRKTALAAAAVLLACLFGLAGCGGSRSEGNLPKGEFSYATEQLSENADYNANLFYLNSLEFAVADPSVIYITEGKDAGYFYAYGTSDDINCHGFQSWRSKDLTHWESMGVAFKPDFASTWASTNYWACETIYDSEEKLYYMFYNAENYNDHNYQYMSVAYSETPYGPFIVPDNRRDANGDMMYSTKPVFDVTRANKAISLDVVRLQAIDVSPFIDPVSHKKYLYFSYFDSFSQSEIFGMEMKDWFTPVYSTLTQLTAVGYLTVEAGKNADVTKTTPEGTINEGPFMYYSEGVYYMTLSVYGFTDDMYQVRQALSTSPLGIFTKERVSDGGTIISTNGMWDHLTSAGHHSFILCGDELFIAYHTFKNRVDVSGGRALAIDRVEFVENANGKKLLHANGPTYSLQALPEQISGYKNIAADAAVTSDNTADGSDTALLNDGVVKYQDVDLAEEYEAAPGKTKITLTWKDFVTARAVMVYNSFDYDKTFVRLEKVEITYLTGDKGETSVLTVDKVPFDWDWHAELTTEVMRPGGAAIVEFDDLAIKSISVTVSSSVKDVGIDISEIVVLGKDAPVDKVKEFKEYNYVNPAYGSPALVNESRTFGKADALKTMYGYDLSHDDGTADAYIEQNWCMDQYAYFKDVFSTKLYIEADITVTEDAPYAKDGFPKFGIAVSSPENSIFYYVDAVSFSKQTVGCAQRTLDNMDWNWNATEQLIDVPGLVYKNGSYIKMALIRDGASFYMLINDKLVISYDKFAVFNADKKAAVGFLTFNTGVKIKNYSATSDAGVVAGKIADLKL